MSDFFVPEGRLAEHKIQSRQEPGLTLRLDNVPKLLGALREEWCPRALIVTFKLETDASLLAAKADASLQAYRQDVVVCNLLSSHRSHVMLRFADGRPPFDVHLSPVAECIETQFVPAIVALHSSKLE